MLRGGSVSRRICANKRSQYEADRVRRLGVLLPLPALFIYGDPSLSFLNSPDLPHDVSQYRAADGIGRGSRRGEAATATNMLSALR